MHVTSTLALAGVASAAFNMAVYPSNPLFRRGAGAYQPEMATCREGNSCAEACGEGFEQCSAGVGGGEAHCVNARARESCCTAGAGHSCADGFLCTVDEAFANFCCPDEQSLSECGQEQGVKGKLQYATGSTPPTTSTATTPTTTPPPPPSQPSTSAFTPTLNTTTMASTIYVSPLTSICTTAPLPSAPYSPPNATTANPLLPSSQAPLATVPAAPAPAVDVTSAAAVAVDAGVWAYVLACAAGVLVLL